MCIKKAIIRLSIHYHVWRHQRNQEIMNVLEEYPYEYYAEYGDTTMEEAKVLQKKQEREIAKIMRMPYCLVRRAKYFPFFSMRGNRKYIRESSKEIFDFYMSEIFGYDEESYDSIKEMVEEYIAEGTMQYSHIWGYY